MELLLLITLFVVAIYLGVELITKVPPTLHTPLMSGSNAISGISFEEVYLSTKIELTPQTIDSCRHIFSLGVIAMIRAFGRYRATILAVLPL